MAFTIFVTAKSNADRQLKFAVWMVLVAASILWFNESSLAQDYVYQTGSPAFSVEQPGFLPAMMGSGFLNVANGNLHLEFPLDSAPQRGRIPFEVKLVYDSRIWQVVKVGGSLVWKPTNVPNSMGGWRVISSADVGTVTNDAIFTDCGTGQTFNEYNFIWHAPDGTQRKFPVQTAQDYGCGVNTPSADAFAIDSSGYHMYVTNYDQPVVYAKDGTQVYPTRQDTNGNHFSVDANGNVVDTLGRTLVSKTTSGNQIFYDVLNSQGTTSRFTITTASIPAATGFAASQTGITDDQEFITVVRSLKLPSGDIYTFNYDESDFSGTPPTVGYGMLQSITGAGFANFSYINFIDSYGVVNRWEAGATYSVESCTVQPCGQMATFNGITYFFTMNGGAWANTISAGDVSVTRSYDFSQSCSGLMPNCSGPVYVRATSTSETRSVGSGSISSQTTYGYDSPQNGNVNVIKQWNFYPSGTMMSPPPATPDRQTVIVYNTESRLTGKNIIDRPQTITLCTGSGSDADCNGSGTKVQQSKLGYDSYGAYSCRGGGTGLLSLSGVANHDDVNFGSSNTARGNLTSIQSWIGGSSFLTAGLAYDTTGQTIQETDAAGNATCYGYADSFFSDGGAGQPSAFTAPQPTNAYPTSISFPAGETVRTGYYYGSGQQAIAIDANNQQTYQHFSDIFGRLTKVVSPKGWQAVSYSSSIETPTVDVFTGLTDTQPSTSCTACLHAQMTVDVNGHLSQAALVNDPEGFTVAGTAMDLNGDVFSVTRPQRGTLGNATTTSSYDVLHRLTQMQNPDSSTAHIYYGADVGTAGGTAVQLCSTTNYGVGYPILSVDEAGRKSQAWRDAFGRVIEADEPDATNALTVPTCYQYNLGGELTSVAQGTLPARSYQYDPLWRLKQATTPESGTDTYSYTNDDGSLCSGEPSAVCKHVDARGVATRYKYDSDGRLKEKDYSDGTPTALFSYGESSANSASILGTIALTNTVGRLSSMFTRDSSGNLLTGEVFSYDAAGNVIDNSQCTPQNCVPGAGKPGPFLNTYIADLAGNITAFNNNWGRSATNNLNEVGQVTSVTVSGSDTNHPGTIFSNAKYSPEGNLIAETLGNGLEQAMQYSKSRGWLENAKVGNASAFSETGGNAPAAGQVTINIGGFLQTTNSGSFPGTAFLRVTGFERTTTSPAAQAGSGSLVINGLEQFGEVVEVPATAGSADVTVSGAIQSKQMAMPAVPSAGSFALGGTLQRTAAIAATPGAGSVAISGSEQSTPGAPATTAGVSIAIQGGERTFVDTGDCNLVNHVWVCHTIYDSGSVSLTVNGVVGSCSFSRTVNTSSTVVASCLASAITNAVGSPVLASTSSGSNVITMNARSSGASGNYAFSVTAHWDSVDFSGPPYTGTPGSGNLTGGADASPTIYDSGSCTVFLNGTQYQQPFGQGDTPNTIATNLAGVISAGTLATATASATTISLTAKAGGAATNYPLSSSCSHDSSHFSNGSFAATPSGANLTGGKDTIPAIADRGSLILTVNSTFNASACFGASGSCAVDANCGSGDSTPAQLACLLASPNNPNGVNRAGSPVTATWTGGSSNVIRLTSKTGGLSTNYAISSSSTYDTTYFSASSFTANRSGVAMGGGNDATARTLYDSGNMGLAVGNYSGSASYGPLGTRSSWANRDLSPYTSAFPSPITAFLAGSNTAEHFFHLDSNNHIHETWLDAAGNWHDQDNTASSGAPAADPSPLSSFFSPNSTLQEHVFYTSGGHVREQFSDANGQWHDQDVSGPAGVGGTSLSSLPGAGNTTENVFYEDANQHIHELYLASGTWHNEDDTTLGGATALAGTPLVSFRAPDLSEHVFLFDSNHHVIEQHNGGAWFASDLTALTGAPPAVTSGTTVGLTGFADPSSTSYEHAFYMGSDFHIHHLWLDPAGWHQEDLNILAGIPTLTNGQVNPLISFLGNANSLLHVFYRSIDSNIHHLWSDSSGWHDENISSLAGLDSSFGLTAGFLTGPGATLTLSSGFTGKTFRLSSGNGSATGMAGALVGDPTSGINATASPVNGTLNGSTIHLAGRFGGTISNYVLNPSTAYDSTNFSQPSFGCNPCPSALTGGLDPVATQQYDSGNLSVTINSHSDTAPWGQGATSQGIAAALAAAINQDTAAPVTATAQGNTVLFQAKTTGQNTNYPLVAQLTHDTVDFDQPSFTAQASGSSLTGGGATGLFYDSGAITVTINGHTVSIPYGQGDTTQFCDLNGCTPGTLDTRLANAISSDPASPVWASLCCRSANVGPYSNPVVINLQSKMTGSSSNYPVVLVSATNNSNFTGTSFAAVLGYAFTSTCTQSGASTLCNGSPSSGTQADSGIINVSIGSFTGSIDYGTNPIRDIFITNPGPSDQTSLAAALAAMINQSPAAPVIATAQGSNVSLIAKTGGAASNYVLSTSSRSDDTAHFPSTSFTLSPASGALTGGAAKPNLSASSASIAAIAFPGAGWVATPTTVSNPPCGGLMNPLTLVVNEHPYTICITSNSQFSTASPVSVMAQTINSSANTLISASVSGNFLLLQSTTGGVNANYFIDPVSCPPTPVFGTPAFCLVASGPAMTGGSDNTAGSQTVYALDVGSDTSGTVSSANDSINGNWTYSFDPLNRLQQALTPGGGYTYDYDQYGNRLHQTPLNGGNALSLLYINNQIQATGVTYDLAGNMTSDGNHTYIYDAENRLISVDNGQTATYVYTADGLRVRSTVGATFNEFIHDRDGKTVGVLGANGVLLRQEFAGTATYSDAAYFHHRDWLGNLRVTTDQTGAVKQTCTNLPFGDGLTCTPAGITPEDFTGYMRDGETGLDFANARYYSSQFGRFLSVDPHGGHQQDPQSLNPYAYASNNPLSFTDPSGMDTCLWVDSPYGGSWDCSPSSSDGGGIGGPAGSPSMGGGFMSPFGCFVCFDFGGDSGPHLPGPPSMSALKSDQILGAPRSGMIMSGLGGLSSGAGIGVFKALWNPATKFAGAAREVQFGFYEGIAGGGRPRWVRSFHIDAPHDGAQFFHINADGGVLKFLNHNMDGKFRLPEWAYKAGTESVMRGAGKALLVAGVAMDTYHIVTADRCERAGAIGGALGGWAGGLALGAAVGSIIPGFGTIIGGAIGGIIGGIGGEWIGNAVGKPADCP